eukprot:8990253-Pyramimonas_sp.AAC.1
MSLGGLQTAQKWPKRAPRGPQDGSRTTPGAPKSAPRAPEDAMFEPPREGPGFPPPLFEH